MAITPSNWAKVLTIPESYTPSSATSGQTLVITEAVIAKLSSGDQAVFWSNVENGGGDIRICTSSDGTGQLPVEVVSCDNVAETCVIWTRKATYDGAGDLYVFVGKSGETQPAVTDPFGRNAVWQDCYISLSGDSAVDSTGNSTATSNVPLSSSEQFLGQDTFDFNGSNTRIDLPTTADYPFTLDLWLWDRVGSSGTVFGAADSGLTNRFHRLVENSDNLIAQSFDGGVKGTSAESIPAGQWIKATASFESNSSRKLYINGAEVASNTQSVNTINIDRFTVGTDADSTPFSYFDGYGALIKSHSQLVDANFLATEHANQNDPATFYGTPTISDTGGATGVTADVTATVPSPTFSATAEASQPQPSAEITFTVSAPTFSASAEATLPQPVADIAYTVSAPTFSVSAEASLPQPQSDVAFTVSAPTFSATASATIPGFNASVAFDVAEPVFSATASATQPQPSADVALTINAPTFSATGSATLPQPQGDIAFTVTAPQFAATASATEPGFNADIAFTVPWPLFSASATATLPQPDAAVSLTIPEPIFSVVAIVGGIAIIVDEETNINAPVLSTNINAPILSNNIEV